MRLTIDQVAALALATAAREGRYAAEGMGLPSEVLRDCAQAVTIAMCESGGDPGAVNRGYSARACAGGGSRHPTGLMQIIPACHPPWTEAQLLTPAGAMTAAWRISRQYREWGQWECRPGPSREATAAVEAQAAALGVAEPPAASGRPWWDRVIDALPGAVLGPIGSAAVDVAGGAVDAVTGPIDALRGLLDLVSDGQTWMRVLWVVTGAGLVIVGAVWIASDLAAPDMASPAASPITP